MNQQQNAISLARVTRLNDCRLDLLCLTPAFRWDLPRFGADLRPSESRPLGTPPGGILLRDPSAAEQDIVTITFYQLQKGCDHHVLSAADQQERPTAVNEWPYRHVLQPQK